MGRINKKTSENCRAKFPTARDEVASDSDIPFSGSGSPQVSRYSAILDLSKFSPWALVGLADNGQEGGFS